MLLILDSVLLSTPGAGKGEGAGVKTGGLEGLFVPGDRNWGGAGPPEPAVPWGHVIQGTVPALPSSLSGPQASARQAQSSHRGPQQLLPASHCAVFGPDSHVHPSC